MSECEPRIDAHRNGDTVWIDMFCVPPAARGRGEGRRLYEAWERALPSDVRYVMLVAADTGGGASAGFWERMGFDYRFSGEGLPYEPAQTMIKGVNRHPTPPPIVAEPDDETA